MRFCVEGFVKQGRWEPDRVHHTKALSLGFRFWGCFCWSWGKRKVWQTEGCSQSVTLHAETSSNTFLCKSPHSRKQRENEPALNEHSYQHSGTLSHTEQMSDSFPSQLVGHELKRPKIICTIWADICPNRLQTENHSTVPLRPEINILWVCLAVHSSHEFIKRKFCLPIVFSGVWLAVRLPQQHMEG